jgi:K+-sensing histidine kinase KdpD
LLWAHYADAHRGFAIEFDPYHPYFNRRRTDKDELYHLRKVTRLHSRVSLNVYSAADRVIIDVADHCGGLPPGIHEELFMPFHQSSVDRSGLGLGPSICRRNVEANSGVLRVRNLAGLGGVFTIDLPRHHGCTMSTGKFVSK